MARCGYTPTEIDAFTFPQYQDLCRYWADVAPPIDVLLARYLGVKGKQKASGEDELAALAAMPGGTRIIDVG